MCPEMHKAGKPFSLQNSRCVLPLLFQISMSENITCCVVLPVVVSTVFYPKPGRKSAHEKMYLVGGLPCRDLRLISDT